MVAATSLTHSVDTSFKVMGTTAHLVVVGGNNASALARHAERRLRELERRWSRFLPDSEISRLNASSGAACVVSDETYALVARAVAAWARTDGFFDPTVLPALRAAGYDRTFSEIGTEVDSPETHPIPAPGCADIELLASARLVRLPRGTEIDMGGIGKGFAADLVAAELRSAGAEGACVNVGGDLRVFGPSPSGGPWSIDVEDPFSPVGAASRLGIADGAVATTSRLRRAWSTPTGLRHHLIDARTGAPADSGLAAVTVVAGEAWCAEVLTKAAFLAGPRDGARMIADDGAAGVLVCYTGARVLAGTIEAFLA